jgi:hypothetical protein
MGALQEELKQLQERLQAGIKEKDEALLKQKEVRYSHFFQRVVNSLQAVGTMPTLCSRNSSIPCLL